MSKAKSIAELVTYETLKDGFSAASVFQDVPNNFDGDVVIVGDMKSRRFQLKTASDDRYVDISIVTLVTADERAPLLALQDQIEVLLDGQSFEKDGWEIEFEFQDDDAVLTEDGSGYSGISSFQAIVIAP